MSEALAKLKEIGAQKIYEDTHIPTGHIQSILYENFEGLNKLQFLGFLSIIEREYGCNLSELRSRGIEYYDELSKNSEVVINEAIYKAPSNKKNMMLVYIIIALVIFMIAVIYSMDSSEESFNSIPSEGNIIEEVKQNIIADRNNSEDNSSEKKVISLENNDSENIEQNITLKAEPVVLESKETVATYNHSFEIISKKRVWLGYIDLTDQKKYQKTFKGKLELDSEKEWLLYFGHGHVDIVIDGEVEKFNDRNTLRLYYKDGKLRKITLKEFRRLNRGKKW